MSRLCHQWSQHPALEFNGCDQGVITKTFNSPGSFPGKRRIARVHIVKNVDGEAGSFYLLDAAQQLFGDGGCHRHVGLLRSVEGLEHRLDQHAINDSHQLMDNRKAAVDDDLLVGIGCP